MKKTLNIAHRGAHTLAHENTLEAMEQAIALGADMVEFDLRRTVDGVIVLWHNEFADSGEGSPIPISGITVKDLEMAAKRAGFDLARFDDVLREFGSQIAFDIEVKSPGFEKEVIVLLRKHGPLFQPVISSFQPDIIRKIKELDGSFRTGLVVGASRIYKIGFLGRSVIKSLTLKSRADSVHLQLGIASATVIKELTGLGFSLYIWTVNETTEMERLIEMGVDGLITDRPDLLKSVMESTRPRLSEEEIA